ncbi:MAG: transposase [Thermoprotei archaeon]
MEFRELSNVEWNIIKTLLPPKPKRGRKVSSDDGSLINGILYVITTGCRWREMPRKYGSYVTAWRRLRRLQELGIWEKIMNLLSSTKSCENVAVDNHRG